MGDCRFGKRRQKGRMGLGRTDAPGSSQQPTRTRRAMPSGPVASSWPSMSSCGALGRLLPDSRSPTSRIRQGRADPPHLGGGFSRRASFPRLGPRRSTRCDPAGRGGVSVPPPIGPCEDFHHLPVDMPIGDQVARTVAGDLEEEAFIACKHEAADQRVRVNEQLHDTASSRIPSSPREGSVPIARG